MGNGSLPLLSFRDPNIFFFFFEWERIGPHSTFHNKHIFCFVWSRQPSSLIQTITQVVADILFPPFFCVCVCVHPSMKRVADSLLVIFPHKRAGSIGRREGEKRENPKSFSHPPSSSSSSRRSIYLFPPARYCLHLDLCYIDKSFFLLLSPPLSLNFCLSY